MNAEISQFFLPSPMRVAAGQLPVGLSVAVVHAELRSRASSSSLAGSAKRQGRRIPLALERGNPLDAFGCAAGVVTARSHPLSATH